MLPFALQDFLTHSVNASEWQLDLATKFIKDKLINEQIAFLGIPHYAEYFVYKRAFELLSRNDQNSLSNKYRQIFSDFAVVLLHPCKQKKVLLLQKSFELHFHQPHTFLLLAFSFLNLCLAKY